MPERATPGTRAATLVIVRHGETPANTDGVWHGSTDTPLTSRGQAQALRVARYLAEAHAAASALYCSDLQRARHTAEPISSSLGLEARVEPGLREYDLGSWEGKTYRELYETHRLWHHMKTDPHYAPHGGESPLQVTERFTTTLQRIHDAHPGERVVLVSHGGALSMVFAALLSGDYTQWTRVMDNCAVTELRLVPKPSLPSFNHTEHLEGL